MPIDQLLLLATGLFLVAAVAVTVAFATSHPARREPPADRLTLAPRRLTDGDRTDEREGDRGAGRSYGLGGERMGTLLVSPGSSRQVARVVAFLFLASVAVVVALTGAWPGSEAAIFTLLAAGTLLVVLFMDMLPGHVLGRARRPVEGLGAIAFMGLLMALTGGIESPFFVGFFLVVAGTALSTEGLAPIAIALLAAATVAVVGVGMAGLDGLSGPVLGWIGFNAVALILLADIAGAAARSQRRARDEALRASRFDALTGLYNRSFFFTTMEQEIRRSDRMGRGFTMLMLDLDDLKPVNDTFGHQWGDRLLKAIADIVRGSIRFTDSGARYGGDEFVVLLPETDAAGGLVVGEKLRRDIASLSLRAGDRDVRSSVSIGLVSYPADGTTIEQLVAAADVAMYESKRRGKNRIVGYRTRMERIATVIDAGSAELVQLEVHDDTRTGGDPAPWSTATGPSDPGADAPKDRPPQREGAIAVRPDIAADPRRRRRTDAPDRPGAQRVPDPDDHPVRPRGARPETSTDPRVADDPPATGEAGRAEAGRPDDANDRAAPWLTRTRPIDPHLGGPPGPPRDGATDAPSRGERIEAPRRGAPPPRVPKERPADRPWIAFPIEPFEPPDRPSRQ